MITIKALEEKYIENIVNWCAGKDADFLRQWAGQGYEYPLTVNQIVDRLAEGAQIYEFIIDNKIVGTIEVIKIDNENKTANLGRFVLDQSLTAKGLGTEVLTEFKSFCKSELAVNKLAISVFDFNVGAHKCYIKVGFKDIDFAIRANGWKAINMEVSL